jgi:(2R)-3-sulfolactate dehydrogenase (NADP+)
MKLTPKAARQLIFGALTGAGTSAVNACYLAEAVLDTELSGLDGHGFYWLQYYCAHLKSGKVSGKVRPRVMTQSPVSFRVNARGGLTHPAIESGFVKLIPAAQKFGIAAMSIHNSYNAATLGFHTGYIAKAGLIGLGFTNANPMMAPVGGKIPILGTNPLSFAVPGRKGKIAFLIDQTTTATTYTSIRRAAENNQKIPLGWGVDKSGNATTDPQSALAGSMAPLGGYKGFGLALMVEVLCAAVAGALRGPEMGSFTEQDGKMVGCGQFFIAINPKTFSGGLFDRQIKALIRSITDQEGARLPNARRVESIRRLTKEGIPIDDGLYDCIKAYVK